MADFCKSCEPQWNDLAGLCPAGDYAYVLCESCGYTLVDSGGYCTGKCEEPTQHAGFCK